MFFYLFIFLDETQQINGAELQVNGNSGDQSNSSNQKYSQILGDHHTNYTTQLSNKSTSSSSSQPHPNNFRARSFNNNKENYYNQRSALRGASGGLKNGWRGNNGSSTNYRATAYSLKDNKKVDENVKSGSNNAGVDDDGKEPIKFNEGELQPLRHIFILCEKFLRLLALICIERKNLFFHVIFSQCIHIVCLSSDDCQFCLHSSLIVFFNPKLFIFIKLL